MEQSNNRPNYGLPMNWQTLHPEIEGLSGLMPNFV